MSAPKPLTPDENRWSSGARAAAEGARAAGLLGEACRSVLAGRASLHLEVVRALALGIERELDAAARSAAREATPDLLAEAALRCADLATLAASNVTRDLPEAATVVRRAAGAARALRTLVETGNDGLEGGHAENLLRDARGVGWRVDLAVRQVEESLGNETTEDEP
jgi:hypothetical protein